MGSGPPYDAAWHRAQQEGPAWSASGGERGRKRASLILNAIKAALRRKMKRAPCLLDTVVFMERPVGL